MSPPERCVLAFDDFHMSKRLRSRLRQDRYRVTFDRDFDGVIKACAGRREGKWHLTWITPQIMHAYSDLHDAGYAHSFEVWNGDGELVGGGYGVAVGGAFTIESQFTRESHTSKIGFAVLNWHLAHWGFLLNDNKGPTRNSLEMGFRVVPRAEFLARLAEAMRMPDRRGMAGRDRPARRSRMATRRSARGSAPVRSRSSSAVRAGSARCWLPVGRRDRRRSARSRKPSARCSSSVVAADHARSTATKNPSVSVRRGVISSPSSVISTARRNRKARSPSASVVFGRRHERKAPDAARGRRAPARRSPPPAPST